ncbi:MAG: 30S ribosomal protein S16 [Planctomycetota bacterium]|nr:30S ribosomal protein S16 [Planctomycetota bacterium]
MAVRIRMRLHGRKHRPFFRICVIDRQKARDGLPIEEVGTYDPMVRDKAARVKLDMERVDFWISKGALPSDRVATLIKKIKANDFGSAKPAPERVAPKPLPVETPAAEGEAAAEPAAEG